MSADRKSIWIISPAADLGLLILTPLAIIPLVSWLAATRMTPEAIGLAVFAFASLGHHLPGLMRAYGDRELFAQYRWRFLLAPPLAVAVCWLSFVTFKLHGLELLLLVWATWHILMQTYGFMRIYDMKQGNAGRWHANWDFYACLTVFAAGFVFSDIRMFSFAETLSLAGVPLFGATTLTVARWLVGLAAVVILGGYLSVAWVARRRVAQVNWLKILLLASTALLYWWSGNLSVNLLVGVAMFDIFHAVQYDAIVWYYNRRRAEKGGASAGLLAWLFHRRWWALPLYIGAIAAFGTLGLWSRSGQGGMISQLGMVLFAASAMLHFYYDGFIWKVSQPKTSENLSIGAAATGRVGTALQSSRVGTAHQSQSVDDSLVGNDHPTTGNAHPTKKYLARLFPSRHAAGWLAFASLLLVLGLLEFRAPTAEASPGRLASLARLTPEVPELQLRLSQQALSEGRYQQAFEAAQQALRRRPRSYEAHLSLADAAYALHDWEAAQASYLRAAALRPAAFQAEGQLAESYFRLGQAAVQEQQYAAAGVTLRKCLQLRPQHARAHYQLGNMLLLTEQPTTAAEHFQQCVEAEPTFTDAYNNLGAALYQADQLPAAAEAYRRSINLQPDFAPAHYNLALVLISQGETVDARRSVLQAASLGQQPSPEVLRAVGF